MKRAFALICASFLVFLGLFAGSARADVSRKTTTMTINVPMKIPSANVVLPAGTYMIKLLDVTGSRNIVRVLNDREDKVFATVVAIPNYRLKPSDKSEFTFWETPAGEVVALRSWFYPGDNYGVEFAYPRGAAQEIARVTKQNILTVHTDSEEPVELSTAHVGITTPEGGEEELAKEIHSGPADTSNDNQR
jgi:hypothetical protein